MIAKQFNLVEFIVSQRWDRKNRDRSFGADATVDLFTGFTRRRTQMRLMIGFLKCAGIVNWLFGYFLSDYVHEFCR